MRTSRVTLSSAYRLGAAPFDGEDRVAVSTLVVGRVTGA